VDFPFVNGYAYSWASINISVAGEVTALVQSIDYENARTRGMGRGATGRKTLRGQGTDEPSASVSFYRREFDALVERLGGDGFQDVECEITVSYREEGLPIITDTLESVLINTISASGSDDSEDLMVIECELDIMDILWNGKRGRKLPGS
jgi:hypothetical protein